MRPFVPEGSQIDPRWFSAWGEQFGAPELAAEMAQNPRISSRVALSVLENMHVDVRARFDENEIVPIAQYVDDRKRLTTLCGLVVHGELIRGQVARAEFETLSKFFKVEDLRIAVSLSDLHGSKSAFGIEINKLAELVERSGKACVQAWKSGLSEQMAVRLKLLETEEEAGVEEKAGPSVEVSGAIVLAVSRAICGLPQALAA